MSDTGHPHLYPNEPARDERLTAHCRERNVRGDEPRAEVRSAAAGASDPPRGCEANQGGVGKIGRTVAASRAHRSRWRRNPWRPRLWGTTPARSAEALDTDLVSE